MVCDGTMNLHFVLRRSRPGEYGRQRAAVEFQIQRFPTGTGSEKTDKEIGNGTAPHFCFWEVYSP